MRRFVHQHEEIGSLEWAQSRHAAAEEALVGAAIDAADNARKPAPKVAPSSKTDYSQLAATALNAVAPFIDRFAFGNENALTAQPFSAKPAPLPKPQPPKTSPWVYVGVGAGALTLVGIIVAALTKGKK
ncbi:MAG: hypothetical protein JWM53_503 [bacterium]|nr:hypothetical protein [bacterium]